VKKTARLIAALAAGLLLAGALAGCTAWDNLLCEIAARQVMDGCGYVIDLWSED